MANRHSFSALRLLLYTVALCLFVSPLSAADGDFPHRLEWVADENALEYKVEVRSATGGTSRFFTTKESYIDIKLAVGRWRYRVFSYDLLGREASVSAWTLFDVLKMNSPDIDHEQEPPQYQKQGEGFVYDIDVSNVGEDSTVALVNERTGETITGTVVVRGVQAQFDELPSDGDWVLRVTNPGGLSDEVPVQLSEKRVETDEERRAREAAERAEAEAARRREEEERRAREAAAQAAAEAARRQQEEERRAAAEAERRATEERRRAEEEAARIAEEQRRAEAEAARIAEEEARRAAEEARRAAEEEAVRLAREQKAAEKQAKRDWRAAHPYIPKDINIMAGAGIVTSIYDGQFRSYSDDATALSPVFKLSAFPKKSGAMRFGFELSGAFASFQTDSAYYQSELTLFSFGARLAWQRRLFSDKLFLTLKGGGALTVLQKNVEYLSQYEGRAQPDDETFLYPAATAGVSIFLIPLKYLVIEAGVDVTHVGIPDMPTGFLMPYVSVGLRL